MADSCFFRGAHFRKRPAVGWVEEDRIVSKPFAALGRQLQATFDDPGSFPDDAVIEPDSYGADEAGSARGCAALIKHSGDCLEFLLIGFAVEPC